MQDENGVKQETRPIDFSTLNDVPTFNQPDELVVHIPTAFASSPMVPPDYQVIRVVPRQLQPRTDSRQR